jgi:hypothetical protein
MFVQQQSVDSQPGQIVIHFLGRNISLCTTVKSLASRRYEGCYGGGYQMKHIFALFIDLIKPIKSHTAEQLAKALIGAIRKIEILKDQVGLEIPSSLNLVISDGQQMVATRYSVMERVLIVYIF